MQQISVVLPVAAMPAEPQGYVDFTVGVPELSKQRDAAQALVKLISSPEAGSPHPAKPAWSRLAARDRSTRRG
jgi:hypothetical protein